ncbi:cupin domain-containing protein [Natronococcus occultus]|uniref:Cupin domain-containing protein n=1 Tax=Natronococcus occultus SP4 TaxID=694430 RepID=L0JWA0_9EURY|nr:cupin domain-containing protein [Natronococcus occultus]AGB37051.1 cupin domain-containing protein [Natronococcus occultus SP4]
MEKANSEEAGFEEVSDGVYLADLAIGERASVKLWRIDPGAELPVHEHDNEQIGYMLEGRLVATAGGEEVTLAPGDCYRFPSRERHGAENRSSEPAIGIGVLAPPRKRPDWGDA